jgi:hypothetical protein
MERKPAISPENTPLTPVKSPPDESTSFPLAAQIPLSSFTLPAFPPTASHLRELTLTSDIPLPDYQPLVTSGSQYELPQLPPSITHLTLELFSLGFPGKNPHFLTDLAKALPNLKSITFFSCLLDGLTDHSRSDAEAFFSPTFTPQLREIHIIDTFVRPGFWSTVTKAWNKRLAEEGGSTDDIGIKVFEVSYTFRGHEDSDFLARLHGEELPLLIQTSIVGAGFGLVEVSPEEIPDADAPEAQIKDSEGNRMIDSKRKEVASGILPFASDSRATTALKDHIQQSKADDLAGLKVLNLSLWTITIDDLGKILSKIHPASSAKSPAGENGLVDLTASILLQNDWLTALTSLLSESPSGKTLLGLEIVGVPSAPVTEGEDWASTVSSTLLDEAQKDKIQQLGNACEKLVKVEMSILKARKAGRVAWLREEGGEWTFTKI